MLSTDPPEPVGAALGPTLVALSAALLAVACGSDDGTGNVPTVDHVEVTPNDLTLAVGETGTLTAVPRGSDGEALDGVPVVWTSQSPAVATVDEFGTVEGRSAGTAVILASAGGATGSVGVVVENPAPVITSITPDSARAGETGFALHVDGSGFTTGSTVRWAGSDRPTTFIDGGRLRAEIRADDVREPGTYPVTVANPTPGGGSSDPATFTVVTCIAGSTAVEETRTAELAAGDCVSAEGALFDLWTLVTEDAELFELDVASDAFDPAAAFEEADGTELASDDDSGPGDAARLAAEVPLSGEGLVRATTSGEGAGGSYTLTVRTLVPLAFGESATESLGSGSVDAYGYTASDGDGILAWVEESAGLDAALTLSGLAPDPIVQDGESLQGGEAAAAVAGTAGLRSIHIGGEAGTSGSYAVRLRSCRVASTSVGSTLSDALGSGECDGPGGVPVVLVTFDGSAGSAVTLDVASGWDNRAALWAPDGALLGRDDDGGAGTDARLTETLPADGTYIVEISASAPGTTGAFELTLTR